MKKKALVNPFHPYFLIMIPNENQASCLNCKYLPNSNTYQEKRANSGQTPQLKHAA